MGNQDTTPIKFHVCATSNSAVVTIENNFQGHNNLPEISIDVYECPSSEKIISNLKFKSYIKQKVISDLKPNKTYEIHVTGKNNNFSTKISKSRFSTLHAIPIRKFSDDEVQLIKQAKNRIKNYTIPANLKSSNINKFKILCIGRPGAGKSSFLNTIHGIMTDEYIEYRATGKHGTSVITQVLSKVFKDTAITIIDTPGFSSKNNTSSDYDSTNLARYLPELLKGFLKDGYKNFEPIRHDANYYNSNPTINDEIHAVVIFYDINNITSNSDSEMMKQLFKEIIETYRYKPLVILTKCDLFHQKNLDLHNEPTLEEVRTDVLKTQAKKFIQSKAGDTISLDDIKLFINYTCDFLSKPRDVYKEIYTLEIIYILIKRAEQRNMIKLGYDQR